MGDKRKEKWDEMVNGSKKATEDFNDYFDDKAIIYAANQIKELESDIETLTLRLMGEEDRTHSPEAHEVLSRWIPVIAKKHNIKIKNL